LLLFHTNKVIYRIKETKQERRNDRERSQRSKAANSKW